MRKSTSILPEVKRTKGFTIVELLIVIVVIAVLAAITIVAYNGIQQRARDSQRKSDLSQIAKALHIYNVNNGNYISTGSGCGGAGNGSGFFNGLQPGFSRIVDCLMADTGSGAPLTKELSDPQNQASCSAGSICKRYMKSTCSNGTFLFASLESEPTMADIPEWTGANGCGGASWDTTYGMNYMLKVN